MKTITLTTVVLASLTTAAFAGDALDRAAISNGIAKIKPKIAACGDQSKAGGKVKVRTTVGPDGKVTSATADGGDEPLRTCVVAAMKTATFAKTTSGGSFSYPFVFAAKTTAPPPAAGGGSGSASTGTTLDRAMITAAIAGVKPQITACAGKAKGTVKLSVKVAPEGKVTNVEVQQTPEPALGACVAAAVQKATFAKTDQGGSFSYPFVF